MGHETEHRLEKHGIHFSTFRVWEEGEHWCKQLSLKASILAAAVPHYIAVTHTAVRSTF